MVPRHPTCLMVCLKIALIWAPQIKICFHAPKMIIMGRRHQSMVFLGRPHRMFLQTHLKTQISAVSIRNGSVDCRVPPHHICSILHLMGPVICIFTLTTTITHLCSKILLGHRPRICSRTLSVEHICRTVRMDYSLESAVRLPKVCLWGHSKAPIYHKFQKTCLRV